MKLIAWIMSRFAVSPELIGDITEDYVERRSLPRLMRQSTVAMATTVPRGLWHSRRLTLCALETGWILYFLWHQFYGATMMWWLQQPYQFSLTVCTAVAFFLGWVVARLQDRQPMGAVLLFLMPMIVIQGVSDVHYMSSNGFGRDLFRFVEIQLWTAWTPLLIALMPAIFAKPQRFSNP